MATGLGPCRLGGGQRVRAQSRPLRYGTAVPAASATLHHGHADSCRPGPRLTHHAQASRGCGSGRCDDTVPCPPRLRFGKRCGPDPPRGGAGNAGTAGQCSTRAHRRYLGVVFLVAKEPSPVLDPDGVGRATRFGFRWFVPDLLKHRKVWRDVLLASLVIQCNRSPPWKLAARTDGAAFGRCRGSSRTCAVARLVRRGADELGKFFCSTCYECKLRCHVRLSWV